MKLFNSWESFAEEMETFWFGIIMFLSWTLEILLVAGTWLYKEAGFLIFALVYFIVSFMLFAYCRTDEFWISYSTFVDMHVKISNMLLIVALIDFFVLWHVDTWNEITNKGNIAYALFFAGLFIAGAVIGLQS